MTGSEMRDERPEDFWESIKTLSFVRTAKSGKVTSRWHVPTTGDYEVDRAAVEDALFELMKFVRACPCKENAVFLESILREIFKKGCPPTNKVIASLCQLAVAGVGQVDIDAWYACTLEEREAVAEYIEHQSAKRAVDQRQRAQRAANARWAKAKRAA